MNTIFLFISKWPILLNNSRIDCFPHSYSLYLNWAGIAYYFRSFQKLSVANANSFLFFPVSFSLFSFFHFFYCTNKKKYRFCFAESQLNISIKANKRKILKKKKHNKREKKIKTTATNYSNNNETKKKTTTTTTIVSVLRKRDNLANLHASDICAHRKEKEKTEIKKKVNSNNGNFI